MKKIYFAKKIDRLVLLFVLSLFIPVIIKAQMPPHPDLIYKIQSNKNLLKSSYYFNNQSDIHKKGIDAPWASVQLQKQRSGANNIFNRSFGPALTPTGSWKALVILVQFSDKPKQVIASSFDNLLFGASNPVSLNSFYKAVSYNNLDIITVNLPGSTGWFNAPQNYPYYVNGQNGFGSYPQNAQKLVEDAVTLANPYVDFSQYDNDHDGYVDALFVIHTGPGAEFTGNNNDIWSHAWSTSYEMNVDGVKVSRYSIEPEYWQSPGDMTVGVFAHELGHAAFGLPDLYDTDYSSEGLGHWSLMAGGSWNGVLGNSPSFPDAWCHSQMGYITPSIIGSNVNSVSIANSEENSSAYLLSSNGSVGKEYFLVENRQKIGFDSSLINAGLCVYHIDENVNTGNTNEWYPGHTSSGHFLVALEQADGLWELEKNLSSGNSGDVFPGSTNNSFFNDNSLPDSKNYNSMSTGVAANNITVNGTVITADFTVQSTTGTGTYLVWDATGNNTSASVIKTTLESLGYSVDLTNNISSVSNINQYKSVFICLGVFNNNHVLSASEADLFVPYLQAGGKIFMEGGDTWAFDARTSLHSYFNIVGIADGTSDLTTVSGVAGSFTLGMTFNYSGGNNYIDRLGAQNGSIPILQNTAVPYNCAIAYDAGTYRTIGTSFDFGGLVDGVSPSTKQELMTWILKYFNSGGLTKLPPTNVFAGNGFKGIVPLTWDPPLDVTPKFKADSRINIAGDLFSKYKSDSYLKKLLVGRKFINYNPESLSDTVSYYKIYRSLIPGGPYNYYTSVNPHSRLYTNNEDYIDSLVSNGSSYYYVITALYTDGMESGFSSEVTAAPDLIGKIINSNYSTNDVTVDGIINPGEWLEAASLNISQPGLTYPITLKIKNDDKFLYVSMDDPNNISDSDGNNGLAFYFDDNNNGTWDPYAPSTEGNFWLYLNVGVQSNRFRGISGTYPDNLIFDSDILNPTGVTSLGSIGSGHLQIETKIDLNSSVLNAVAGGTIGAYLFEYDPSIILPQQYHFSGIWPMGSIWAAPSTYGKIKLAAPAGVVPPHNLTANLNPYVGEVALAWEHNNIAGAVYEDFSGTSSNTFIYSDNRFSLNNGYLVMTGTGLNTWANMYYDGSFDNSLIEYKFEKSSGDLSYTIGCFLRSDGFMGTGNENGYLIAMTASGSYSAFIMNNGVATVIIGWTPSTALNSGLNTPNIVSIVASGNHFQIYVNGIFVNEFYDNTFTVGKVNLCTYDASGSIQIVKWDYLNITPLSSKFLAAKLTKHNETRDNQVNNLTYRAPGNNTANAFNTPKRLNLETTEKIGLFRHFNIYRNNVLIDSTANKNYLNLLPGFGVYSYKVTAYYDGEETAPAGPVTLNWQPTPRISVNPLAIQADIIGDTIKTTSFSIKNSGSANLVFNISETPLSIKSNVNYPSNDGPGSSRKKDNRVDEVKLNVIKPVLQMRNNGAAVDSVLWLDETPLSGTILPGDSTQIQVTFNGTGLSAGSHLASINVLSNDTSNSWISVSAALNKLVEDLTTIDNENNLMQGIPDGDMDVYLFNDSPLAPIEFNIFIKNTTVNSAQLNLLAYDVDWEGGERDSVVLNGHFVGYLTGANDEWSTSLFNINPAWIVTSPSGKNTVQIFIDVLNVSIWAVTVDWGQLVINGLSGNAKFRYVQLDKTMYNPGENVIINGEADADPGMAVRVETNLVDPFNQIIAGTSRTFTATMGNEPYQEILAIPGGAVVGQYNVMSLLYDATTNILQDQKFVNFAIQVCSVDSLSSGWNIVSVPVLAPDMNTQTLFPNYTSPTYGFSNGYVTATTLSNGKGYWLRYGSATNVNICGTSAGLSTIPLDQGWNLIGPYEKNIDVANITTTPLGIINSQFYGFKNTYIIPATLQVGKGYWIRASQSGVINIPTMLAKSGNNILSEGAIKSDWGRITVTDNEGRTGILYSAKGNVNLSSFDLPPVPPAGIFDVRFSSNRYVETVDKPGNDLIINSGSFPVTIQAAGITLNIKDKISGKLLNKSLKNGESIVLQKDFGALSIELENIPISYAMYQNYPNPFNPSTTIKYDIPENTKVNLSIYNVLGELVQTLVNEQVEAGYHQIVWNAGNMASGIYFYMLTTDKYNSVKKLILMK